MVLIQTSYGEVYRMMGVGCRSMAIGATGFIKNETGQEPGVGLELPQGSPEVTDH